MQSTSAAEMHVSLPARFWLGAVMPALVLGLFIALVLATGRGRGEAPLILFFASLAAVPAVVLLNCWVLFVAWKQRSRLFAAALVLPALIGSGAVLFVHGTRLWQEAGMLILLPFLNLPMRSLGLLTVLWGLGIVGLLLTARRISRR